MDAHKAGIGLDERFKELLIADGVFVAGGDWNVVFGVLRGKK